MVNNGTVNLGGTFSNSGIGLISRTNGAVNLTGVLNNASATFSLNNSTGSLDLLGGTIRGGTVSTAGTAQLVVSGDNSVLDGVSLVNSGSGSILYNPAGKTLLIQNGLTLTNTTFDLSGGKSNGYGYFYFQGTNSQTIGGTGEVTFGNVASGNSQFYNLSGTNVSVTFGPNILIHGGSGSIYGTGGGIINQGTISADVPGRVITLLNSQTNTGSWQAINGGTLNINAAWSSSGTIVVNSGTVNLGGTFLNSGIGLISRTNGVINLTGILNNAGATLGLNDTTGSWNFAGGTIRGGTVTTAGTAQLVVASGGGGILDGVTLATGTNGTVYKNGQTLEIHNGLTLTSPTLDLSNGQPNGYGYFYFQGTNSQTIGGTGEVTFGNVTNTNSQFYNLSGTAVTVTFGPNILIHGGSGNIYGTGGGLINQGTISADVPGRSITLLNTQSNTGSWQAINGGTLNISATSWHNSGTIVVNNGTVNLGGNFTTADVGTFNRTNGVVNLTGNLNNIASTLALNNTTGSWNLLGGTIRGGTVNTAGTAQLIVAGNGDILDGVTLDTGTNGIAYNLGQVLYAQNGLTLDHSTLDLSGGKPNGFGYLYFQGTNSQTLSGTGDVTFGNSNSNTSEIYNNSGTSVAVTFGPGITIHGKSGSLAAKGGGIINQGTLAADILGGDFLVSGLLISSGSILSYPGTTMDFNLDVPLLQTAGELRVNGHVNLGKNGANLQGGSLTGSGVLNASAGTSVGNIIIGGTLSPGNNGIGTLTITGNVVFNSGAHLIAEASGSNSADLLAITGNLDLSSANDFLDLPSTVAPGGTYKIATYTGNLTGTFDQISPHYTINYDVVNKQILITAIPEPSAIGLLIGTAAGLLLRQRRKRRDPA